MKDSLFDFPQVSIQKPIRLIEAFGGIGSQGMALRDIGADFEHYRLIEFDKYAVASYNAIHGTNFETTDIRNVHGADLGIVEKEKYEYIFTYSFPCTDLSVAGKMEGMSKKDWASGKSTRSGLLWEVERILSELHNENLPQILVMENVPQVHAEQNKNDFDAWLDYLKSRGYWNFWKDLNAKDYGVPQNRERCFCVSVLSDEFIDYEFPEPIPLETVMKDFLESDVDEKYYIKSEKADRLIQQLIENGVIGTKSSEQRELRTIDLCVKSPREIKVANCILAKYDCGISNLKSFGAGVLEKKLAVVMSNKEVRFKKSDDIANTILASYSKGIGGGIPMANGVVEITESETTDEEIISDERIIAHLDDVLEDDETEFGGTDFDGETLEDFMVASFADWLNTVTLEDVNEALKDCGIKQIKA